MASTRTSILFSGESLPTVMTVAGPELSRAHVSRGGPGRNSGGTPFEMT
ncbi:MAG: hypothetical protein E7A56_05350 [Cutibacterium avidum]|nr:hypothetical protein [Cutibacterium avidum]